MIIDPTIETEMTFMGQTASGSTTGDFSGGGTLFFNYKVWRYIAVGADAQFIIYPAYYGDNDTKDISILGVVKGMYPLESLGMDVYGRLGLGYSRIIPDKGDDANAFALNFFVGATYDILDTGFFAMAELGVTHRNWKVEDVKIKVDGFTFNLGVGYAF